MASRSLTGAATVRPPLSSLAIEHKAGRTQADVWSTASGISSLIEAGLIERFATSSAAELPAQFRDPSGYWAATNMIVVGAAANTGSGSHAPPTAQLRRSAGPAMAWRDRLKLNDMTGAWGFIGNVLTDMGEEGGVAYLRQLSTQNIAPVAASTRAILDGVVGGEHPMVLGISAHNTEISRKAGAPVVFLPLSSAWTTLHAIGVTAGAPHPNAAGCSSILRCRAKDRRFSARPATCRRVPTFRPCRRRYRRSLQASRPTCWHPKRSIASSRTGARSTRPSSDSGWQPQMLRPPFSASARCYSAVSSCRSGDAVEARP